MPGYTAACAWRGSVSQWQPAVVCTVALVRSLSRPGVRGDGIGYYAPVAFDSHRSRSRSGERVSTCQRFGASNLADGPDGRLLAPYPVGAGILWMPVLRAAWITDPRRSQYGHPDRWRFSSPGFAPRYLNAVAWATGLEALVAAFLLYGCARRTAVAQRRRSAPGQRGRNAARVLRAGRAVVRPHRVVSRLHAALLAMAVRGGSEPRLDRGVRGLCGAW
jgi:hypothetical protein